MLSKAELDKLRADLLVESTMRDVHLRLYSTWGTFSPREVDEGTDLLLRYIEVSETDDCLDLGCGYGPIGLTLAKLAPQGHTTLVDRDFIAVEYAQRNIQHNNITNADALLSNGFAQIRERQFDVIASNIPAKVGNEMLSLFLHDALQQLKPDGRLYVVTINGLRDYMKRNFKEVFGNYKKLKQGKNYTVAMAEKN
ncbi:MAG: class I SAM-dependent methyltransferase [Gammaproteobacteria bacterium]|nr:class I SAM-dependent methyltransferase [Gammaproteobacteria bacterium]MDH5653342.1 class I SAM-dependent methyltransferase [Gammaproteobacteria bacterium]